MTLFKSPVWTVPGNHETFGIERGKSGVSATMKTTGMLGALTCAAALTVSACGRCETLDTQALMARSNVVFRGTVVATRRAGSAAIATFQVAQSWKGPQSLIHLRRDRPLKQGGEYLVFAAGDSVEEMFLPQAVEPIACARDAIAALNQMMRDNLAAAQARWSSRKPATYEFVADVGCFCGIQRPPPRFRVTGERSEPITPLDDVSGVYETYNTVDKMFAAIRLAIEDGAEGLDIRYDPEFGYPVFANLNPLMMAFDEERRLRVVDFRPISPRADHGSPR